jgi:hypothetical protein
MGAIARRRRSIFGIVGVVSIGMSTSAVLAAATSVPQAAAAAVSRSAGAAGNIVSVYSGASKIGELDCNGNSPVQAPLRPFDCTDIRGLPGVSNENNWDNRFYDNSVYIGHDEPDATFLSNRPGTGGEVSWSLTLGSDPAAAPTATSPGDDVSHWFELTPAPWLSMAICDPNSYPQLPCKANSDSNAPEGQYPGAGSAFMEM